VEVDSINPVILGISSSLIATLIFISLSKFFSRVVLPWYENKIYKGVRVDGKWDLKEGQDNSESVLNLNQSGDLVSGTHFHSFTLVSGGKITESYHVKGYVKDGYFFATLDPISNNIVDSGTIHMKIFKHQDKLHLKGSMSGVSADEKGEIKTFTVDAVKSA